MKTQKIAYPIVFDPEGRSTIDLGDIPAAGPPYTLLIDKQGRVAAVYFGIQSIADIKPAILELVAGR